MKHWSARLFTVFGIKVEVHATFLLLLAFFCWQGYLAAGYTGMFAAFVGLMLVFTSVLLHEFGHCLTAMEYGIHTPRILLLPIGGMAMMNRIPRRPSAELAITVAGPLVNFVIAGVLYAWVGSPRGGWLDAFFTFTWHGFAYALIYYNIFMGLFNLIPVFPMDGGRIFRALLAMRMSYLDATRIATYTAKAIIVVGIGFALFSQENYLLAALFAFIWLGGEAEYQEVRLTEMYRDLTVGDITVAWLGGEMDPALEGRPALNAEWELEVFARKFENSPPELYPVYHEGAFVGVVDTARLDAALVVANRRRRQEKKA